MNPDRFFKDTISLNLSGTFFNTGSLSLETLNGAGQDYPKNPSRYLAILSQGLSSTPFF
jgi:hypothetical protein